MIFGQKWVKILIVPSFQLKFDDVTVTFAKKLFPFLRKLVKTCWGVASTPPPPLGHWRVKKIVCTTLVKLESLFFCNLLDAIICSDW